MADTTETVQGPQGPVGPAGPQGIEGPTGPVGPQGPAGVSPSTLAWLEARIAALEAWIQIPAQHIPSPASDPPVE